MNPICRLTDPPYCCPLRQPFSDRGQFSCCSLRHANVVYIYDEWEYQAHV